MKTLILGACAIALSAFGAQAATLDMFDVNLNDSAGTDSTLVLMAGVDYEITVSGVGTYATGGRFVDAAFHTDFNQAGPGSLEDPARRGPIFGPTVGLGVAINGVETDFGAAGYQSDNTYSIIFTGLGSTINVGFIDTNLGDNTGSFAVTIGSDAGFSAAVPLPAGGVLLVTALGGVAALKRKRRA